MHQRAAPICIDAIRKSILDCVAISMIRGLFSASILLPLSLRSLFSLPLLNQTIPDRLKIRSFTDFIAGRLFASCLGFIRLDKGSPGGKLREEMRRQRRVTAAINDRAASQQNLLDLRGQDLSSKAGRPATKIIFANWMVLKRIR